MCQLRLTHVDLAAMVRGEEPRDACRWLAGQLGIHVECWHSFPGSRQSAASLPPPAARAAAPTPLEALLATPNPVMPETVFSDLLERTTLSPAGAAYLRKRGIPPDFARQLGFRSIDGPSGWAAVRKRLATAYSPETLKAAGFPLDERGRVWTPFGGLLPMVLIPYRHGGRTVFVRMRTSGPPPGRLLSVIPDWADKSKRYRSPRDVVPPVPFNADALASATVHVVEGEMNAATLILPAYGLQAIGLPGAGVFERAWASLLAAATVVTWYDDDEAGCFGRSNLAAVFTDACGNDWVRRRLYHMRLPAGTDPNGLHVAGRLAGFVSAAPWKALAGR